MAVATDPNAGFRERMTNAGLGVIFRPTAEDVLRYAREVQPTPSREDVIEFAVEDLKLPPEELAKLARQGYPEVLAADT